MQTLRSAVVLAAAAVSLYAQATKLPPDVDPKSYSRLPLLSRDQLDANGQKVFEYVNGKDKTEPSVGPAATSMYSMGVAEPLQALNQYLRKTVVGPHYFEICAILAAREYDQAYEWSSHELGARRSGVDQNVIDAIKFNRDVGGLPEKDALVIRFGRSILKQHKVSPELYAQVVQEFGKQGMFELVAVMGDYAMVAMMLDAVDQQLPPDRQPLLPVN